MFRRLLVPTLNSAKSSNSVVRTTATRLFKTIIEKMDDSTDLKLSLEELLILPKSGKTAGPDHRVALYTMLGYLTPSPSVSPTVVQSTSPLLAKETHDSAVSVLASSLTPHLLFCLRENISIHSDVQTLIAKEMTSAKPPLRRAFCSLTGDAFWQLGELTTEASSDFAKVVFPSYETNLKTVAASPIGSPAGPLEAYIAIAILLGPFARGGKFGRSITFCYEYSSAIIPDTSFCLLVLQTIQLVAMQPSSPFSQQAPSHPFCCGRKYTRSFPIQMMSVGFSVPVNRFCRPSRRSL